jgi:hypothetical protein
MKSLQAKMVTLPLFLGTLIAPCLGAGGPHHMASGTAGDWEVAGHGWLASVEPVPWQGMVGDLG